MRELTAASEAGSTDHSCERTSRHCPGCCRDSHHLEIAMFYVVRIDTLKFLTDPEVSLTGKVWGDFSEAASFEYKAAAESRARWALDNGIGGLSAGFLLLTEVEDN
jgi:hypothetical protein